MKYRMFKDHSFYGGYISGHYGYRYVIERKHWFPFSKWKVYLTFSFLNDALDALSELRSGRKPKNLYKV